MEGRDLQCVISSWVSSDWLELGLQRNRSSGSAPAGLGFTWQCSASVTSFLVPVKTTQGIHQYVISDSRGGTSAPKLWFISEKVYLSECKEKGLRSDILQVRNQARRGARRDSGLVLYSYLLTIYLLSPSTSHYLFPNDCKTLFTESHPPFQS